MPVLDRPRVTTPQQGGGGLDLPALFASNTTDVNYRGRRSGFCEITDSVRRLGRGSLTPMGSQQHR